MADVGALTLDIAAMKAFIGIVADGINKNTRALRAVAVNPKTFGAIGDGQADDTAAIQQALNNSGPAKAVYLTDGTYRCTAPLDLPDGTTLFGSTSAKLVVTTDYTHVDKLGNDGTYVLRPGRYCSIEKVNIDCGGHSPGGILMLYAHGSTVRNCTVTNWHGNHFGIGAVASNNTYIVNNTLKFGDHAIHAYKSNFTTVIGNQIDCVFSGCYTGWSKHCLIANNSGSNGRDVLFDLEGGMHCYVLNNHAERAKNGEYTIYSGNNEDSYVSHHLILKGNTAHRQATYVTSYNADGSENTAPCDSTFGACCFSSLDEGCYESGFEENTLTVDFGLGLYHCQLTDKNNRQVFFRNNTVTSTTGQFWRCLNSDGLSIVDNKFYGKATSETGQNETRDMHNGRIVDNQFFYDVQKTGGYTILLNTSDAYKENDVPVPYATSRPVVANNKIYGGGDYGLMVDLFFNNNLNPVIQNNQLTDAYTPNGGLVITSNGNARLVNQKLKYLLSDGANELNTSALWRMGVGGANGFIVYGRNGYNGSTASFHHAYGSTPYIGPGIQVGGLGISVNGSQLVLTNGTGTTEYGHFDVEANSF